MRPSPVAALRTWLGSLHRPGRRALLTDALLWAVLALPIVADLLTDQTAGVWWRLPCWLLALTAIIVGGRSYPLAAMCGAIIASAVLPNFLWAMPVMSFLAGRRMARARPTPLAFAILAATGTAVALTSGMALSQWANAALTLLLVGVFPWLLGRSWRQYQELLQAGWERADQLEREHRIIEEQTRLRERARIAQDMHDSLGHDLGLLALRAGTLEVDPTLTDDSRAAAGDLRSAAGAATERLQEIIGLLREAGDDVPSEPAYESVSALVERSSASGLAVELDRSGDTDEIPTMVDRATYRIVQECLTNAAKHAPGTSVTVRLRHTAADTVVTVSNGAPSDGPVPPARGGRGLIGLRERARLVGGELHAFARDEGGFEVVARLPHATDATSAHGVDNPAASGTQAGRPPTRAADELRQVRQRVRRSVVTAVLVPAGFAVVLGAVLAGQIAYDVYFSTLPSSEYARLDVGQRRAAVESVLPPRQYAERPDLAGPAPPAGSTCRYYRADLNPINPPALYRLCFAGDRLVDKDRISGAEPRSVPSSPSASSND